MCTCRLYTNIVHTYIYIYITTTINKFKYIVSVLNELQNLDKLEIIYGNTRLNDGLFHVEFSRHAILVNVHIYILV